MVNTFMHNFPLHPSYVPTIPENTITPTSYIVFPTTALSKK